MKEGTISPIAQYVLDYEEPLSSEGDSWEEIKTEISQLKTIDDVENYYTDVRGWADDDDFADDLKQLLKRLTKKFGGKKQIKGVIANGFIIGSPTHEVETSTGYVPAINIKPGDKIYIGTSSGKTLITVSEVKYI